MATPRKRQGATPAPASASTPAPAPAPAPAAPKAVAKPAPKPAPKREERKPEPKTEANRKETPKPPPAAKPAASTTATASSTARPAPVADAVTTSTPSAPVAGTVETPETEMIRRSGPLSFLGVGRPIYAFTESSAAEPAKSEDLTPYLTALGRVEELRRQGKIGEQELEPAWARQSITARKYRPAIQPVRVSTKFGRDPLIRNPYASQVEMPTERELDIRAEGAQKMQQVMRDRNLLRERQRENQIEINSLERQLSAARDQSTFDDKKSRAVQMEARAKEMEAISGRLKQMAARQRELTQGIATKNATLREYGMTDQEIEPK